MKRWLALFLLLAFAAPAWAQGVSPDDRDAWVKRIRDARQRIEDAHEDADAADAAFSRARHRQRARGEKRVELTENRVAASAEAAEAQKAFDTLLEDARRQSVPPGWVRDALDGFEEAPASASR